MTKGRVNEAEWRQGIYDSFAKVKQHTYWYTINVGHFSIVVLPDVFSPKYFTDSLYFAEELAKIVGEKSLLEIGPGTGIASLYCAEGGARVTAIDINPQAVRNSRINAEYYQLPIDVREGDVYAALAPEEKFDFIFWNHPFNDWDEPVEMLIRAGIDPRYEALRRYIAGARAHLVPGGQLLLGSSDMAHTSVIEQIAAENRYRLSTLASVDMPIEEGHEVWNTYFIYHFDEL